jgi:hypothetical protein
MNKDQIIGDVFTLGSMACTVIAAIVAVVH